MTAAVRSLSIDVLRGMTLALMIVVNMSIDAAHSYAPLLHAQWNGLTPTDVVFPTFLFVAGASMSYAMEGLRRLGVGIALQKILRRTALIFLCGYLLYWFPFFHFDDTGRLALLPIGGTRILGVLQRIALDYGLVSLLVLGVGLRGAWVFAVAALLGHWAVLAHFGDYSLQGNAALRLDLFLFGPEHLWHGEGMPFDPEGVLGTLTSAVNMLAGYAAGRYLREYGAGRTSLLRLVALGAVCIALALLWNTVLPINKKLWTSSYVLCTVGIDLWVLALLAGVIDGLRLRGTAMHCFEVFGRNTLFIYLLSEVGQTMLYLIPVGGETAFQWIYRNGFQSWAGDKNGSLLFALAFMALCWLVAWGMDRKRLYVTL